MADIEIELTGYFPPDVLEIIGEDDAVEAAISSGLDGRAVLELGAKAAAPLLAAIKGLKSLAAKAVEGDVITDVEIRRDGVTVGKMRLRDSEKVKKFIFDVLDRLRQDGNA